jgi:hypothetical protein
MISMNLDARYWAWLIQIALMGVVLMLGLWVSPAIAAAIAPGYPVGDTFCASRALIARKLEALVRRHRG